MKRFVVMLVAAGFAVGCGEGDPNKNLKPVSKDVKFESAGEAGAGKGVKAPSVVKN